MYVITGASGHTGTIAAKALLARGHSVRVVGRSADRLRPLTSLGAEAFLADITDSKKLAQALQGAQAAYVLVPPNLSSDDYRGYQERVTDAIAAAVAQSKVPAVVALSGIGADKPDKTGPVIGLHNLEQKRNKVDGVNVLHLRAGYFMENTMGQVGAIRAMGATAGPLRPDLKLAMIASRDIGAAVADALLALDFKNKQTRELLGQRDISMAEVTAVIAKAIGKSNLSYVQVPDDQFVAVLTRMGMSKNVAGLLVEMSACLNSGYMRALEPRSVKNTTPTSYETFVTEEFLPAYRQQSAA